MIRYILLFYDNGVHSGTQGAVLGRPLPEQRDSVLRSSCLCVSHLMPLISVELCAAGVASNAGKEPLVQHFLPGTKWDPRIYFSNTYSQIESPAFYSTVCWSVVLSVFLSLSRSLSLSLSVSLTLSLSYAHIPLETAELKVQKPAVLRKCHASSSCVKCWSTVMQGGEELEPVLPLCLCVHTGWGAKHNHPVGREPHSEQNIPLLLYVFNCGHYEDKGRCVFPVALSRSRYIASVGLCACISCQSGASLPGTLREIGTRPPYITRRNESQLQHTHHVSKPPPRLQGIFRLL